MIRIHFEGMDQLSAPGPALIGVVRWKTVYLARVPAELRCQDHPVVDTDLARLSPLIRTHVVPMNLSHSPVGTSKADAAIRSRRSY